MCFKLYVNLGEQKGPGSIRGFTRATQFPPRATQHSAAQRCLMPHDELFRQNEIRGAERSVKDERYRAKVLQPGGSQRNATQRHATPRHATPRHATTFGTARYALNRNVKFGRGKGRSGISNFARRCCSLMDRNAPPSSATSCNIVRCVLNVTYVWRRGKARAASAAAAAYSITSYRGPATPHRTMLSDAERRALQCNV